MSLEKAKPQLQILFVLYESFASNSAIHVHYLATHLTRIGCRCCVAAPSRPLHVRGLEQQAYETFLYSQIAELEAYLRDFNGPDVIHAWTPRENVRQFIGWLPKEWGAPLIVHLEDYEDAIFRRMFPHTLERLLRQHFVGVPSTLSHPIRSRQFLQSADGVSVIVDELREVVPAGKPIHLLQPGVDFDLFHPMPCAHAVLGHVLPEEVFMLGYTGNVHRANRSDVLRVYDAAVALTRIGIPAAVLRTGKNMVPLFSHNHAKTFNEIALGHVSYRELPGIMACADLLVQPGEASPFEVYRLPSKLPDYLATGRPIILPAVNLGRELTHMQNAFVHASVGVDEIVSAAKLLRDDSTLAERLGSEAWKFAQRRFSWETTAQETLQFYRSVIARAGAGDPGF